MKKIYIAMLALAAVGACNKAEVVEVNPGEAIAFGNVFVDNTTRAAADPSYGTAKGIESFMVYGTVEGVNIFNGVTITKGNNAYGAAWDQAENTTIQYWVAGADYVFDAVVDATDVTTDQTTGLPTTLSYTASTQKDMLHQRVTTNGKPTENNGLVAFTFTHLLSKVKMTVENTTAATATNYRYTITDIEITNAYASGNYAVPAGTWSDQTKGTQAIADMTVSSNTSEECAKEVLLIPGANTQINDNGTWKTLTTTSVAKTGVVTLAANTAYNFTVSVGLDEQIQFTVKENPTWDYDVNNDDKVDTDDNIVVQ